MNYFDADLPAGYSSSENEFSEDDEDDETIACSNPNPVKPVQHPAAVVTLVNSQFVWTRDTCAKRAVDSCSKESQDSKTLIDVKSSGNNCILNKPTKKKSVPPIANSELGDLINWSWVDKIINDEANTSTALQGSKEVRLLILFTFLMRKFNNTKCSSS